MPGPRDPEGANTWKWVLGAVFTVIIVFGVAYGYSEFSKQLDRDARPALNEHPSTSSSSTSTEPKPGSVDRP